MPLPQAGDVVLLEVEDHKSGHFKPCLLPDAITATINILMPASDPRSFDSSLDKTNSDKGFLILTPLCDHDPWRGLSSFLSTGTVLTSFRAVWPSEPGTAFSARAESSIFVLASGMSSSTGDPLLTFGVPPQSPLERR